MSDASEVPAIEMRARCSSNSMTSEADKFDPQDKITENVVDAVESSVQQKERSSASAGAASPARAAVECHAILHILPTYLFPARPAAMQRLAAELSNQKSLCSTARVSCGTMDLSWPQPASRSHAWDRVLKLASGPPAANGRGCAERITARETIRIDASLLTTVDQIFAVGACVASTPPKRHAYSNEDDCSQQQNQG